MKRIILKTNHIESKPEYSYIVDYLRTLGVDPSVAASFVDKPKADDEEDGSKLKNMRQALDTVYQFASANKSFFLQVDADADGYTSAAIFIQYMRERFPDIDITYRLHDGKQHGIILETVPQSADIVIIPDAGSNQCAEHRELTSQGKTVVILDHHEINKELFFDGGAIIVNNQDSPEFKNKNLSGAGVVYKFIQQMDNVYFYDKEPIYSNYADLASIGIIADAMNMLQLDNNFIAYQGLNNVHSKLIKQIARAQSRGIKDPEHLSKIDVAFYIAPIINGVIRSGDDEDKRMFFRALIENNCIEDFHTVWRGKDRHETLYEIATRLATNAKSRQDNGKKKSFEWLCDKIKEEGLDKDNIIIIPLDEKESSKVNANVTGLIAMELVKKFNKPCLLLRESTDENGEKIYGGSGRNGNFYELPNLLDYLHESNCVDYAEGHQGAFGVFLKPEQVQQLRDYSNKTLTASVFNDKVYEVDYWFHTGEVINYDMLMEFASYDHLYGNSIPQPKFCFDVNFTPADVMLMGANKNSIRITIDHVSFIAFNDDDLAAQLNAMPNGGHATIIGRPQINEWQGRKSVQVMIDDIDLGDVITASPQKQNLFDLI